MSGPNVVLNTIIADTLMHMADELEQAENFTAAVDELIRRTLREHMRIIFNGNGYDASWVEEAARRGLLNLSSTVDALPYYIHQKNLDLFERQKVFSAQEVHSRYEIKLENYVKVIDIEALSMLDIARRMILPAAIAYSGTVAQEAAQKKQVCPTLPMETETRLLTDIQRQMDRLTKGCDSLQNALNEIAPLQDTLEKAQATRDRIVPAMAELRAAGDMLETLVGADYWPMPTYQMMLQG